MNRCRICDVTDLYNPKANIKFVRAHNEYRCQACHYQVKETLTDLSLGDDDFQFNSENREQGNIFEAVLPCMSFNGRLPPVR